MKEIKTRDSFPVDMPIDIAKKEISMSLAECLLNDGFIRFTQIDCDVFQNNYPYAPKTKTIEGSLVLTNEIERKELERLLKIPEVGEKSELEIKHLVRLLIPFM